MPEDVKNEKRQEAIDRLIEISVHSTLGLYRQEIARADAHDREHPGIINSDNI